MDDKGKNAIRLLAYKRENLIAYERLIKPKVSFNKASIKRIVVKKKRKLNYGNQLASFTINTILEKFKISNITIGAQYYLKDFYKIHRFIHIGKPYLEDGISNIYN